MKKCLLLGVALTLAVSSCTTIQNTASSDQVNSSIVNLTVADMKVSDHHVTKTVEWKWNPFTMVSMEAQKKNAVAEAVREADADLLVEPQYTMQKRGLFRGGSVTVTGRPATYTRFRSLTQADAINMAISQGRPVTTGTQTVPVKTSNEPAKASKSKDILITRAPQWARSGITINAGLGGFVGPDGDDHFAIDFAIGYRKHFGKGFSWQILKLGFNAYPGDGNFSEDNGFRDMTFRITTGARYDSPRFSWLKNRSIYVSGDLGYCIARPTKFRGYDHEGGFTFEAGAGVKLSKVLSVGAFYQRMNAEYTAVKEIYSYHNGHRYSYTENIDRKPNWGMVGARLEIQF